MLTVKRHRINTRTSNSSGSNREQLSQGSAAQSFLNGRIRLDPERSCARRVAGRNGELSEAAGFERAYWRIDERLDLCVMKDRFRRVGCLGNGGVMAGQAALIVCGVRGRRFAAVLVATSGGFLCLRVERERPGSQRVGTDRPHHEKRHKFCEALHHWITRCLK